MKLTQEELAQLAASRRIDYTIPASGTLNVVAAGDFIFVETASSDATVRARNTKAGVVLADGALIRTAAQHKFPAKYDDLVLTGTPGATGTIWTGQGESTLNLLYGTVAIAPAGTLTTTADPSVNAGATGLVLAANSSRKTAIISNLAANAAKIRVGDANTGAARGIELSPGQSIALDTTAAVYVYNAGGVAQSVGVLELS